MKRTSVAIIVICLVLSLACYLWVDRPTHDFFYAVSQSTPGFFAAEVITPFGKLETQIMILAIIWLTGVLRQSERFKEAAIGAFWPIAVGGGIITHLIKFLVVRERPYIPANRVGQMHSGYYDSFISGDSASAMAFALGLGLFFPKARIPLILMAMVIALMRVAKLSHWPSDIFAGMAAGAAGFLIAGSCSGRFKRRSPV